jgi:hypothetical protein
VEVDDDTGPGTNVTAAVGAAVPAVAVTVSVWATEEAKVAVKTPNADVVPLVGVKVLEVPLPLGVTD